MADAVDRVPPRLGVAEIGTALGVAVAAFVTYRAWTDGALYDDGPRLLREFARPGAPPLWQHTLYLPAGALVHGLAGGSEFDALTRLGALAAAVVAACGVLSARALGHGLVTAAAVGLLLATAPAVVFHATTIEVHALHAATVAVGITVLVRHRWRGRRAVLGWTALAAALAFLAHRSAPALAPALGLVAFGVLRRDLGVGARALVPVGAAVVAGLAVGLGLDFTAHAVLGGPGRGEYAPGLPGAPSVLTGRLALSEIARPGALAAGLALVLPVLLRARDPLAWAGAVAALTYGGAAAALAIPTHGGYFLPAVPFLALLPVPSTAGGRRALLLALVTFTGAQAALAWRAVPGNPTRARIVARADARIAFARAVLPEGGVLLSTDPALQPVMGRVPGVLEVDLVSDLVAARAKGLTAAEFCDRVLGLLEMPVTAGLDVVLTEEWRPFQAKAPALAEYYRALEQQLAARPDARAEALGDRAYLRLERAP